MTIDTYQSLDGQVALVTGATRGIGEAIAQGLADHQATVYGGGRTVGDISVDSVTPISLDVTKDDTIREAIARITSEAGQLDILVNNAGIAGPEEPLHRNSIGDIDSTLAVNLRGAVITTRLALPLLLETTGSRVINISSGMGALGEGMSGRYPPYRIAKAGLNALTVYLHGEYREHGLLANAACPGWVRTALGSPTAPKSPAEGADTPIWLATFKPEAPAGRFWRDREIIEW